MFNVMPVAALVANKRILCMHGGLSKELNRLSDIEKIQRPTGIPPKGLLTDLLWSDPDKVFCTVKRRNKNCRVEIDVYKL